MGFLKNRQEARTERKKARQDARTQRVQARQDARTQRRQAKWDSKSVAYSNGLDPNASMWQGITGITSDVSSGFQSYFTGGLSGLFSGSEDPQGPSGQSPQRNYLMILGVIVVLIFLFKKVFK